MPARCVRAYRRALRAKGSGMAAAGLRWDKGSLSWVRTAARAGAAVGRNTGVLRITSGSGNFRAREN